MSRTAAKRRARVGTTRPRHLIAGLLALVTAMSATACTTDDDRPNIVVTTNILGDVTREIVGDEADVTVLMKPNADPHSFGLSAVQAAELEQADLVVYNGLGLEENVLRHVDAARESGVATFAAGEAADPLTFHTADNGGPEGEEGQSDPHFWTDPDRVHKVTGLIADQVIEHVTGVDPGTVRANAERYAQHLADLTTWMEKSFGRVPADHRALVTNHHVFGYLADRFGFEVIGAVIPSGTTLASPSSSDLRSLTQAMERAGVRTVFADSSQPKRLAEVLRAEMGGGVRVVELHSESLTAKDAGADTYLRMMRANTTAMVTGLTGD
ncbi:MULTISPECIES: zinc ABC transporter substrate-binding protein AztC [Streptomyces]|uniref:zinc ABC transporter substrate-binding protein AztC n=1 Tax=Streptomyces TaxID=1883 RepID=UPI001FABA4B6|nr:MULTISPECIES: zinc ABC transporter substrate-binding protein AztC [Streptomyces]MDX2916886.1 zinc ABC transporter substrate-binding protein AztC [Streptomyces sp. NE06-03C]MDX3605063.1 zinc ABC transporter substrate-binding protein AztC [Streptomyces sp. FL06-04B]MDX3737979.1 zinc ABC transporter substrate-binding protein AztC [Streptomyces sp. ID01-15D]